MGAGQQNQVKNNTARAQSMLPSLTTSPQAPSSIIPAKQRSSTIQPGNGADDSATNNNKVVSVVSNANNNKNSPAQQRKSPYNQQQPVKLPSVGSHLAARGGLQGVN